jgi:ABC-2 type transport system permease protein
VWRLSRPDTFFEAWLAYPYVQAWLEKSVVMRDCTDCAVAPYGCVASTLTIAWPQAGGVFLALMILLSGAAAWTVRNRDIT